MHAHKIRRTSNSTQSERWKQIYGQKCIFMFNYGRPNEAAQYLYSKLFAQQRAEQVLLTNLSTKVYTWSRWLKNLMKMHRSSVRIHERKFEEMTLKKKKKLPNSTKEARKRAHDSKKNKIPTVIGCWSEAQEILVIINYYFVSINKMTYFVQHSIRLAL